jgi:adenine/guanine phosphoribosyltransferase-like PRPP-binding protein
MTAPRRARRIDANQPDIVAAMRQLGLGVIVANAEGYDLIVARRGGHTAVVEIKDGTKPMSQQKLTNSEEELRDRWPGKYRVVRNLVDVAALWNELA